MDDGPALGHMSQGAIPFQALQRLLLTVAVGDVQTGLAVGELSAQTGGRFEVLALGGQHAEDVLFVASLEPRLFLLPWLS